MGEGEPHRQKHHRKLKKSRQFPMMILLTETGSSMLVKRANMIVRSLSGEIGCYGALSLEVSADLMKEQFLLSLNEPWMLCDASVRV